MRESTSASGGSHRLSPAALRCEFPTTLAIERFVAAVRSTISSIIEGHDSRVIVVTGPCSVHGVEEALEYARRLALLAGELSDRLYLVMRAYVEKPRSVLGWKGLIADPVLDGTGRMGEGLALARALLHGLARLNVAAGTEALSPFVSPFLDDLVSWYCIGARTVESQTHREMASGLPAPVGLKNTTDGRVEPAIDALEAVRAPQRHLGLDSQGRCTVLHTSGNRYAHLVLRGGRVPNYDVESVRDVAEALHRRGLPARVLVDCSHGNSRKDPARQPAVARACIEQVLAGSRCIAGVMLESNLEGGKQPPTPHRPGRRWGVSMTDACLGWTETEALLRELHAMLGENPYRPAGTASERPSYAGASGAAIAFS